MQVYLLGDKLVFVVPDDHESGALRYFPLDRIPVRGMPRGFKPRPGIALVENRWEIAACRSLKLMHPQFLPPAAIS